MWYTGKLIKKRFCIFVSCFDIFIITYCSVRCLFSQVSQVCELDAKIL